MTGNDDSVAEEIPKRYTQLSRLGAGGVGVVFKAHDTYLNKPVAIKMLLVPMLSNEMVARFQREAKTASLLNHPNIITVLDFGVTESGKPYMVMEFVEGKTLDELIEERKSLTIEESFPIFVQILEGVAHAHKKGVLHRDLKPSNVILAKSKSEIALVKILDFGLAKLYGETGETTLTQAGSVLGSPLYMSPEQAQGKDIDFRSDIYSIGVLMYKSLTGDVPIIGETALETLSLKSMQPAPPLDAEVFPERLCEIVDRTLRINPDERFQSVGALESALVELGEQWQSDEHEDARSIVMTLHMVRKRKSGKKVLGLQIVALVSIAVLGAVAISSRLFAPMETNGTSTQPFGTSAFADKSRDDLHGAALTPKIPLEGKFAVDSILERRTKIIQSHKMFRSKRRVTFDDAKKNCGYDEGDSPEVKIKKLEAFLTTDMINESVYNELARQYWLLGKRRKSMEYTDLLLNFVGFVPAVMNRLDNNNFKEGKYADSIKKVTEVADTCKDLPYVVVSCTLRCAEDAKALKEWDSALFYCEDVIRYAPDDRYRHCGEILREAINRDRRNRRNRLHNS